MQITEFKSTKGFTLIELMVVISIVSILSAVTWASFSQSSKTTRDAERQSDLKILQTAIETYKKENGRYPAQCPSGSSANGWSGQVGTDYACSDGSGEYIVGLKPYLPVLPKDPKLNGTNSGYVYRTNAEGTVYKIKAHRTVESDTISHLHPFKPCDVKFAHTVPAGTSLSVGGVGSTDPRVIGWCGRVPSGASSALPPTCYAGTNEGWTKSYALWGGIAPIKSVFIGGENNLYRQDPLASASNDLNRMKAIQDTTDVICK